MFSGSIHALDKQYTGSIQAFTDLHVMCSPDEQNVIIFAIFLFIFTGPNCLIPKLFRQNESKFAVAVGDANSTTNLQNSNHKIK